MILLYLEWNDIHCFIYIIMLLPKLLTYIKLIMKKEEFKLPDKWCVKAYSQKLVDYCKKWGVSKYYSLSECATSYCHFPAYGGCVTMTQIVSGYTEITLEQFEKYVLKETKIYTIKDLSEGKVVCVNDGTKKELEEVLRTAFPKDSSFTLSYFGTSNYYFSMHLHDWWSYNNNLNNTEIKHLPKQSVKEFYKQLKKEIIKESKIKRFPFKLTPEKTKAIIDIACSEWKPKLTED